MVAAVVLLATPLALLVWLSGGVTIFTALAVMLAFAALVLLGGVLLAHLAGVPDMPLAGAWVFGVFAGAMVTYALSAWLGLRAGSAFAAWGLFVLAVALGARRRSWHWPRSSRTELVGLALCACATLAWCWQLAEAPQILARDRVLFAWIDYFIHGGVISHFGDLRAGRQSMFLADVPSAFYHYASYVLPAALAVPLDLPGLPLATSFWLPLGFLTLCAGAYALGDELAGPAGAVAALAAITVLPDASNYALRNGFLSFHWHLLTYPGAAYAAGVLLLAIVLLRRWFAAGKVPPLLGAFALGVGSLFFRVHLFVLGFPALLGSAAMSTPLARRHRLAFFVLTLVGFASFVGSFYMLTDSLPALEIFLAALHGGFQEPTGYTGWYGRILATYGVGVAVPVGLLLVLAGCLGALALLFPVAVLLARRGWGLQAIDAVPAWLIGTYLLVMLTAPKVKWDSTELTVRPFVLLYAALAVWTFAWLAKWCALGSERAARRVWWLASIGAVAGLILLAPRTQELGMKPKFRWGEPYFDYKVEAGLPQAAAFLRKHSGPGDLLAVQGLTLHSVPTDLAVQLSSLSGIPAYLGYIVAQISEPGERRRVAVERYFALKSIDGLVNADEALAGLRKLGVRWYVVPGERGPAWDPARQRAAFVDGRLALYRAGP